MKPPLALTFLCLLVSPTGGNLVQFGVMIERITGKSALQYNDYGCYCGVGGSNWPVDQTDWCCHAHDCCYGRLKKLGCEPKLEKYLFSVGRDTISCAGRSTCQRQTCECDRRAALCFRHNLGTYNRKWLLSQARRSLEPKLLSCKPDPPLRAHRPEPLGPHLFPRIS
ncbi:group IIE secretory phospholipase A2 isoform X2 [Peromyscus eremicus]|uniref:group IIE secretory phospholipase A2 isoform X2 n=1 Tax=Peromyscus eremicus TaxID=42410 RepID=UPI0027DE92AE|nr:group IIE secretory phospholipase A2 isoform X2 [Peromyscus eremicus]